MWKMGTADVIITVYKPDGRLIRLIRGLLGQTVLPGRIILMVTQKEPDATADRIRNRIETELTDRPVKGRGCVRLIFDSVTEREFDHGGTRHAGALHSDADYLIYMTQDAVPADNRLFERLLAPSEDPKTGAAYARQLVSPGADAIEQYTHLFNYPPESRIKTRGDIDKLGIKAYFCSDVCAAYRRSVYDEAGGFVRHTIFNEDMLMAAAILDLGYSVCYEADAMVYHSHQYTALQQFRRNFDLGVSHRQYREVFGRVRTESEGIRLVKNTARYLVRTGNSFLLPRLFLHSACKYTGYLLGRNYDRLPERVVRMCSMCRHYWK